MLRNAACLRLSLSTVFFIFNAMLIMYCLARIIRIRMMTSLNIHL